MCSSGVSAIRRQVLSAGSCIAVSALFLVAALAFPTAASADRWNQPRAEERAARWGGELPACDDRLVLSRIASRFDSRESRFWQSGIRLTEISEPRETAMRPWGDSYIPRRFCQAQAVLTSEAGTRHSRVDYIIVEGRGIIGYWGVEWCVADLVRHQHAGPDCRAFRP
ncbi:MAG: hypothetical protein JJU21_09240 [Salinarimonas sp.]|nr:hypothetical protein [Salinarimonas sp.]